MNADSCKTQADLDREERNFDDEVMEWLKENDLDIVPAGKCYVLCEPGDLWISHGDETFRLDGNDEDLHANLGRVTRAVLVARLRAEADALDRNAPCETAGVTR